MKQDSDPSFSEELASLSEWDRAFWLSRAFLEASRCLCMSMLEGGFSSQYSSSRVILHLARQSVELFLKGAIGAVSEQSSVPTTHDLNRLFLEYRRLYPELRFSFEVPSRFNVSTNFDLFLDDQERFHSTLDQRHRYPSDRKGNTFATKEVFDPITTLKELEELDRELKILEWARIRPYLRGEPEIK
ncbi:hypothetical protein [Burkholderia gladioli]|uniref:hypothetical protein n=1 Tax=Burkholderia gladioli TaxID=28095 RepID=UPI00164224D3|nr:hypothetical protein [Burkholderia gladioli]MBU9216571.1 hypothetical protein [Burkholderia gladioli]MDN7725402.1 hypothetical protein [Burkholderia gladioli]